MTNKGSRPGKNALVIFTARGNFKICPPYDDDDDSEKEEEASYLPVPPRPPRGKWESVSRVPIIGQDTLRRLTLDPAILPWTAFPSNLGISFRDPILPARHDPDAFYYKSERPKMPVESFSLECEQWRHGIDEKYFYGQIFFDHSTDEVHGAIECNIHAENLSAPVKKIVSVKVSVKRLSTIDHVRILIKNLQSSGR